MIKLSQQDIIHLYQTGNLNSFILSGKVSSEDVINTLCKTSIDDKMKLNKLIEKVEKAQEELYDADEYITQMSG